MLQAERDRESGLANAAKELEEFRTELASEQTSLNELEKIVRNAFNGYRRFIRLLSATDQVQHLDPNLNQRQLLGELRGEQQKTRTNLQSFRRLLVLRLFKLFWLWVGLVLVAGGLLVTLNQLGRLSLDYHSVEAGA